MAYNVHLDDVETSFALLALCDGSPSATGDGSIPPQKEPVAPALVFSLVSTYRRCWTNIRVSDDLKRYILPYMCHKSANKDPVCEFYLTYERYHADGLVQDYSNPIVNALELLQSSTKLSMLFMYLLRLHNDVIKWTHFQRYWPFVRGIHQSPVNSPHKYATMMTSWNGNIFRVTSHLCGEFTGPRWIPHTKASDAELWSFIWSAPE